MKYYVFIIAISLFLNGCSSGTTNQTTNGGANPANANSLAATNANSTGIQPYNGAQNLNPNAFNATNDNLKIVKYEPKKDELPYGSRNAPDDSVISSGSRGADFLETRTFKNHPTLDKVEKIMDGKTDKYKVYLKNGKVVDAPADKMSNFAAMSPVSILEAVGISPKQPVNPAANNNPKKEEKPQ